MKFIRVYKKPIEKRENLRWEILIFYDKTPKNLLNEENIKSCRGKQDVIIFPPKKNVWHKMKSLCLNLKVIYY